MSVQVKPLKRYEILKQISLFSCLNDEEIRLLADISVEKTYPKNSLLINEQDNTNSLYIVCQGKANAILIDPNGKKIVLNTFETGDYFGEMSFLDGEPRCATIETKALTQVMIIPMRQFKAIVLTNPDISFKIMKGLLEKIRKATRQIEELVFTDVYRRVARVLIQLAKSQDQKLVIEGKLTHQEIAEMVGSSREMVSRIFKELTHGEYITVKEKIITINRELPYSW